MFGWKLGRISDSSMEPQLPKGSFALFRKVKRVKRSDIVLVDHPDHGWLVRKVSAVSMSGRIGLRGVSRSATSARKLGNVDPDRILGKFAMRLSPGIVLPQFTSGSRQKALPPPDPKPDHSGEDDPVSMA